MISQSASRYGGLQRQGVIITGGASGIGACLVRAFQAQGASVGFVDVDEKAARALVSSCEGGGREPVNFVLTDVTDPPSLKQAIAELVARVAPLRVLVNNAARDDRHKFETAGAQDWRRSLAVNLDHHFFASQAAAPLIARSGGGAIINMSSNNALMGATDMAPYITAKAGIVGLTRALARELGPQRIRVNAVMPGWVFTERQLEKWATPEAVSQTLSEQCIPERMAPEDISGTVLFLASDAAKFITKQVIVVDGGRA